MSGTPPWHRYPQDIRRSILDKVSRGRGMMVGGLEDELRKDIEAMGLALEETVIGAGRFEWRVGENGAYQGHARAYRCGKGRIIHFLALNHPAHGYILCASPRHSDFEFSAARAGWFLLRAARPGAPQYVTATRFADGGLIVELNADAETRGGNVQVAVHRRDTYEKVLNTSARADPGKPVAVALPQLAGGRYQAEVRVTDGEGATLDWDVLRFAVSAGVRLGLSVDRQVVRPGERVICRLEVEGETTGLETVARWYDNWDRLLVATAPRPYSAEMAVIAPAGSLSVLNRLEVTVHSHRGPEAVASAELLMPGNIRQTDFHMLYWKLDVERRYTPDSWRRRVQWDVLRRDGAADAWADGYPFLNEARDAALCHLRAVPMSASLHNMLLEDELLNEVSVAEREKSVREAARVFRPFNPLGHSLGDENHVSIKPAGRFADTPVVWARFRQYLRGVYPDLAALNAQWGTDFAAWNEIRFANEEQMLPDMDNPSAWVDYRMFVTYAFTGLHRRLRQAIREEDPDALVGWDGVGQSSSYGGQDWWELCRDMGIVNIYHTKAVSDEKDPWKLFNGEAVGSFGGNAPLRGCWMNAADREYGGDYVPWYLALKGWNSAWWWQASYLHPANGPLRWDLGLTPMAEPMAAAVREIKAGPGTLLAHARKHVSPIAVHYSAVNFHASTIESGVGNHVGNLGINVAFWMAPASAGRIYKDDQMKQIWGGVNPSGHYAVASANVYTLLHDLGFEPRTMARQEIEKDALTTSGIRVLILPFVVSLSDQEVEKIREFVAGGGVLIADYRCGLRDGHGRIRLAPALDDVFGIKRESLEVKRGRATLVADIAGGVQFETMFHDPVARASAEARAYHDDGTPALFMHPHGSGQAVYLNTDLYGYIDLRRRGQERRLREAFATLLVETNHLFPPFRVRHRHGSAAGRMEVTRLNDGNTSYDGVLPAFDVDDKAPRPVVLPFPEGTHVYDVRAQNQNQNQQRKKKYLGEGGPIEAVVYAGRPEMYAALPYRVEGLTVRERGGARRGEPVQITIDVLAKTDDMGPHAVRVEVSLPDGRKPEYLARTLYLPEGKGVFSFVPALNSPAGRWSVCAVEAVSGGQASAGFDIR